MKITKDWLELVEACSEGRDWFNGQKETDAIMVLEKLLSEDHWNWANWVIVRVMTRTQYLKYAIFSAEQVISIYEKKYPNNDKPRKAIESAKKVLENDTQHFVSGFTDLFYLDKEEPKVIVEIL